MSPGVEEIDNNLHADIKFLRSFTFPCFCLLECPSTDSYNDRFAGV